MTRKERCLRSAEACMDLLSEISVPEDRLRLMQMAQAWRRLSRQADEIDSLFAQGKEMGLIPPRSQMN
jgi:hypothetical protein